MTSEYRYSDRAVRKKLARNLGEKEGYTKEELSSLDYLTISYANSDFDVLNVSDVLEKAGLYGAELDTDISWLRPRDSIMMLDFRYTPISSLNGAGGFPNLEHIDLRQTMVTDLSPLIGMEKLEAVLAMGTPLDEASYQGEVFEQLSAQGVRVRRSPEDCWQANLRLQATGVRAVYSGDHDEDYFVCAPGLLYSAVPDGATCRITIEQLDAVIAERDDWDLNSFMDRCFEVT